MYYKMPHVQIKQRLHTTNLKEIMKLTNERNKLVLRLKPFYEIQQKIQELDKQIAALYEDTYTDRFTKEYMPSVFEHDVIFAPDSKLKSIANKSRQR